MRIDCKVRKRPAGRDNPELPTGAVEVYVREIEALGPAGELPIQVFGDKESPEDLRLKYRFLDLRRERLDRNIMMRAAVIDLSGGDMKEQGLRVPDPHPDRVSSPEGARDFLVPRGFIPAVLRAAAGAAVASSW